MSLDTALREQLETAVRSALMRASSSGGLNSDGEWEHGPDNFVALLDEEANIMAAAVVDALVVVQGWVCEDYAGLQMARPLCGTEQPVFTIAAVSSRATTPGDET